MKKILNLFVALMMTFTLTSCVATAYAQTDDYVYDDVDIHLVITYGTPCYTIDGLLMYYIYKNMYYYPYYHNNRYYFHRYRTRLSNTMANRYRPVPRNAYKPKPRVNHITRPNKTVHHTQNKRYVQNSRRTTTPTRRGKR